MRMDRRAGLLSADVAIPTLPELFSNISTWSTNRRNSGTSGSFSFAKPSAMAVGETWYYFYCVGDSLEIARIDCTAADTLVKTRLSSTATGSGGGTKYTFSISGTNAVSDQNIYAGIMLMLKFSRYPSRIIDYMLSNCFKSCPAFRNASGYGSPGDTKVKQSTVASYTGLCLAVFLGQSTNSSSATVTTNWSASDWTSPLVPIISVQGSTSLSRTVILGYTSSGTAYYDRTLNGTDNTVYGRCYSLFRLYEDW